MPSFDQTHDLIRQKMRDLNGFFDPFDQELAAN